MGKYFDKQKIQSRMLSQSELAERRCGMRLIDADALKEEVKTIFCPDGYKILMLERIDNAPIVFSCNACKNMGNEQECVDCHDYSNYVHYDERPQGDLISREALKKRLNEMFETFDVVLFDDIIATIDNAPTVDIKDQIAGAYNEGYMCGNKEAEKARPQGEWIAREDMNHLDENKVVHYHFECNKCGLIHDFIDGHTSQYNFCPNCGADMRGVDHGKQ